ncbi:hypothetical protein S40285_07882 [Stachybotrys chlorohalonatus IBT 40285]|uniref:Uncharacterized protein n=1 Tax=Stachybotrys chlorohalonatus (strain IBT 40285) TaxID=1283841 RepID=A0A084Q8Z0_STAC4|nr:hypothetical protein S40285_07882 [Stachybotrys chlorohalonata IBT 40285]
MTIKALVIGGTSGIGYAMACRVAAAAGTSTVIIGGRTKPQNIPHPNIEFRPLEATSMRNIKNFTDTLKASSDPKLDLLIMTQGIMSTAGRTETPEGIDRKMALHYYGKQLFIRELLPNLKEDGKVVIVFDSKFGNPQKVNWEDLDLKTHYSLGMAANQCMVMNDIMVQHFAAQQKLEGTATRHFVHAWPGGVNTNLLRELPWYLKPTVNALGKLILVSPDKCADHLLKGADENAVAGAKEGRYWSNIDNKGRLIKTKAVFEEEQMNKVANHTWKLIDAGLERNP